LGSWLLLVIASWDACWHLLAIACSLETLSFQGFDTIIQRVFGDFPFLYVSVYEFFAIKQIRLAMPGDRPRIVSVFLKNQLDL